MTVKQAGMSSSTEDSDREAVCAGCEHPLDEDEELYPVVLNPQLESDDTPDLVVNRTQETIEFDPDDLQSFLDQYTDREVEVVADHIFLMHTGCIESLFDVDVETVGGGVAVSERDVSSGESPADDSRQYTGMSKPEVVISWLGLTATILMGFLLLEGLAPTEIGVMSMIATASILVHLWPSDSSGGGYD